MPTDIAVVLRRNADAQAQAAKDKLAELIAVSLWAVLGLILACLIIAHGFDIKAAVMLVTGG